MKPKYHPAALLVASLAFFTSPTFCQVPASLPVPKGSDSVAVHSTGIIKPSEGAATNLQLPRRISFEVRMESKGEPISSVAGRSRAKDTYKLTISDPETKDVYIDSTTIMTTELGVAHQRKRCRLQTLPLPVA